MRRIFVINAPLVFTAAFAIVKSFLHPYTVEKMAVLGSSYEKEFAAAGVTLRGGEARVPPLSAPPSWRSELDALTREFPDEVLRHGFMPPADAEGVRAALGG